MRIYILIQHELYTDKINNPIIRIELDEEKAREWLEKFGDNNLYYALSYEAWEIDPARKRAEMIYVARIEDGKIKKEATR